MKVYFKYFLILPVCFFFRHISLCEWFAMFCDRCARFMMHSFISDLCYLWTTKTLSRLRWNISYNKRHKTSTFFPDYFSLKKIFETVSTTQKELRNRVAMIISERETFTKNLIKKCGFVKLEAGLNFPITQINTLS